MKRNLLRLWVIGGFASLTTQVTAQQVTLQPLGSATVTPRTVENTGERAVCGNDEVGYAFAKNLNGNTVSGFAVQGSSTGHIGGISQWFDAPSEITVRGVWILTSAFTQATTLTVSIHTPTADSAPGAVLATGTLTSPFTGSPSWRSVTFPSPLVVTGPYVISVVNTNSGDPSRVRLYSNFTSIGPPAIFSGRGEKLSRALYGGAWLQPASLYNGYDADWIMEPIVSYNMVSDFTHTPASACTGEEVTLTNTSTAVAQSRFYNPSKFDNYFNGTADNTFTWTLADASQTNTVNATTTTNTGGNPAVSLNVNYNIWVGAACSDTKTENITFIQSDDPAFSYANTTLCLGSADEAPNITGGSTGTFTSSDPGLLFTDAATGEIDLTNSDPGTYTVTFTTDGTCSRTANQVITITNAFDASFTYATDEYCVNGTNPLPVFGAGASAGAFTADAGLSLNGATGEITLSTSTPGDYTVTNTIAASAGCAEAVETFDVTINALDDASFDYSAASYCADATNPVANITGGSTGTFTSTGGLVFEDASTGEIDLAGSTAGPYTITFTTNGTCPSTETFDVAITALDDASFDYSAASYCEDAANPVANITGGATGTFSSTAGLVFVSTSTGEINLSGSTPDSYTVTFTTNGTCPNTETFDITINELPTVTLADDDITLCSTAGLYTLTGGTPAGGTYTVDGTPATTFQPSAGNIGTHAVVYTYTDGNGCEASASGTIEVETCVSVNEKEALAALKIFPNPTQGLVTIEAENLTQVEVLNTLGAIVLTVPANGAAKVTLDIQNQPNGIYFVRVSSVNGSVTKKVNLAK